MTRTPAWSLHTASKTKDKVERRLFFERCTLRVAGEDYVLLFRRMLASSNHKRHARFTESIVLVDLTPRKSAKPEKGGASTSG